MKFSIAYYLVLLYLTIMLKPLIPIVSDAWSHSFAEANHILAIHAKYGANHLEKELASGERDDNNKSQNTFKPAEPVPVHAIAEVNAGETYSVVIAKYYPVLQSNIPPAIVPAAPGQPPKFSL